MEYARLKWGDVPRALSEHWLIIPIGSLEQHGPHLPLAVDSVLVERLATRVASAVDGIVAPTVPYGARSLPNSGGGPSYPGTVHVAGDLLTRFYEALLVSFVRCGATRLLVLNGHWENEPFVVEAIEKCREAGILESRRVVALSWWSVVHEEDMRDIFGAFSGWHVEHAGQAETALMLAVAPDLVSMEEAVDHCLDIPHGIYQHPTPDAWKGNLGVLSRTRHVDAVMGQELADLVISRLQCILLGDTD